MKTIEERAREYLYLVFNTEVQGAFIVSNANDALKRAAYGGMVEDAYIKGATEQRELDNKQLRKMVLDIQNAIIDKACEWIENYDNEQLPYTDLDCDGRCYVDMEEFAQIFRKAMKGE